MTMFAEHIKNEMEQKVKYYELFLEAINTNIQDFYNDIAERVELKFDFPSQDVRDDVISSAIGEESYDYDFTLYSAFIVAIYSCLEQTLDTICKHYEKGLQSKVLISDLKDDGIIRSKTFLTKIVGVDFTKVNTSWNKIQDLNKVRNLLVHQGNSERNFNKIDELPKSIKRLIDINIFVYRCHEFDINIKHGRIYLKNEYCKDALIAINEFIDKLLDELPPLPVLLGDFIRSKPL